MAYTTIDDPSEYFQAKIYTGTGNSLALTNDGNSDLQPDWIWIKGRNFSDSHHLTNTSVGLGTHLRTNTNAGDYTNAQVVTAVASDGFTVGTDAGVNTNTKLHVAWQWKANGGTTTTNDASSTGVGTIDSVIQANTEAGFNIVTYTGTGSNGTVAHGLGVVPNFVIYKRRSAVENWGAYHTSTGNTGCCFLNLNIAKSNAAAYFNNTSPTATTLSVGTNPAFNGDGSTYVAYCLRNIKGYSRIGVYTGIGSDDGTFVYTGFKPAWVMIKRTNAVGAWTIYDTKRALYGNSPSSKDLQADATGAENASTIGNGVDILSNGFKPTTGTLYLNGAGSTYIYLAFAERPFVTSTGTPTTAR